MYGLLSINYFELNLNLNFITLVRFKIVKHSSCLLQKLIKLSSSSSSSNMRSGVDDDCKTLQEWNRLPIAVTNATKLEKFKASLLSEMALQQTA
jgi:hypothetical protein